MYATYIDEIREVLLEKISKYNGKEPLHLDYDGELLQKCLFEVCTDIITRRKFLAFWEPFKKNGIYKKIDFSNIPLNNVCLMEEDLSDYRGIKVDPQVIYDKSLVMTKCDGVEFVGSFDDVCIMATDFRGSRGAKIDPQTIHNQDFLMTKWNEGDIEFIGSFENCVNMGYRYRTGRR